jgi:hypothetical protein
MSITKVVGGGSWVANIVLISVPYPSQLLPISVVWTTHDADARLGLVPHYLAIPLYKPYLF